MRRKDREVTDRQEILDIISRCVTLHLGLVDEGKPYVVPLNFGWEEKGGQLVIYFHSAREGRKIDILKKNPVACFQMECAVEIYPGPMPQNWSCRYECVMGEGTVFFIEDPAEKQAAFTTFMQCVGFAGVPVIPEGVLANTALCKLIVQTLSAKRNPGPAKST